MIVAADGKYLTLFSARATSDTTFLAAQSEQMRNMWSVRSFARFSAVFQGNFLPANYLEKQKLKEKKMTVIDDIRQVQLL